VKGFELVEPINQNSRYNSHHENLARINVTNHEKPAGRLLNRLVIKLYFSLQEERWREKKRAAFVCSSRAEWRIRYIRVQTLANYLSIEKKKRKNKTLEI